MEFSMKMDAFDFKLLRELAADARATHVELASRVRLSPTACARRIESLEQQGVIRGYRADIDASVLGYPMTVIVRITLESQRENALAAFEAAVEKCPDVISCHLMSGSDDYLLQVLARDLEDFERIHKQHLSRMPGVARIHSSFAMRSVVNRTISPSVLNG
jgi:Lrp/AsnC family leucine-responsive transcriptional regulator